MKIIFETLSAVLISVGGASAIVIWLSSWLGKVWADRILEQDKARYNKEIEGIKNKFSQEFEHYKSQIEIYKLTILRYSEYQFGLYNRLWASLVDLKISGDKLWGKIDKSSVLDFGAKVKKAKENLLQSALLIEEEHERALGELLCKFDNYQIGKHKLVELSEKKDDNFWPGVNDALTWHDVVQDNGATKKAYDELLLSIKASFRKQLKEG